MRKQLIAMLFAPVCLMASVSIEGGPFLGKPCLTKFAYAEVLIEDDGFTVSRLLNVGVSTQFGYQISAQWAPCSQGIGLEVDWRYFSQGSRASQMAGPGDLDFAIVLYNRFSGLASVDSASAEEHFGYHNLRVAGKLDLWTCCRSRFYLLAGLQYLNIRDLRTSTSEGEVITNDIKSQLKGCGGRIGFGVESGTRCGLSLVARAGVGGLIVDRILKVSAVSSGTDQRADAFAKAGVFGLDFRVSLRYTFRCLTAELGYFGDYYFQSFYVPTPVGISVVCPVRNIGMAGAFLNLGICF